MNPVLNIRPCVVAALLAAGLLVGRAEEEAPTKRYLPWERGYVKLGGFAAAFDSTVAFGLNKAAGVTLNAEELLDLDSSLTVFRAEAMYRPGKSLRHQVDFTYASYHRNGNATLGEGLTINDMPISEGAQVHTIFDFDIIRGTYSYALLQDERMRIA